MDNDRLINQGWEHLDGVQVTATVLPGYEDAPLTTSGALVVTEMMDMSGNKHWGYTYTLDGWSVIPESIEPENHLSSS